jgi:hypothetical protein
MPDDTPAPTSRGERSRGTRIDLEGVRFPRRLREARRLRAIVELNASLPDSYPALLRCRAFRRYAAERR